MRPTLKVRFYATLRGAEPVRTWLRALPRAERKVIGEDIKTVQFGWPLGMPLVRKMVPDLWEIRSALPQGIARVFFTVIGVELVLLHGFVKKTSATPAAELGLAKRRMKEIHDGR
jgi:phage-related protein